MATFLTGIFMASICQLLVCVTVFHSRLKESVTNWYTLHVGVLRHQNQITTKSSFWQGEYVEFFRCLATGEYLLMKCQGLEPVDFPFWWHLKTYAGQCFLQPLNHFSVSFLLPSPTSSIIFRKTPKLTAVTQHVTITDRENHLSLKPWRLLFFARTACLELRLSLYALAL